MLATNLHEEIPMHETLQAIEAFMRSLMGAVIAHDVKHAQRVRQRARTIALAEGYPDLAEVEAAALLHDIGLSRDPGRQHAVIGAQMAEAFLCQQAAFGDEQIARIVDAIRHHSDLDGSGPLWMIVQDADGLELFGAIGLLRGISSKGHLLDYEEGQVLGSTWGASADDFTQRFRRGLGIGPTIVDQLNFQISCYDNLHTATACQIAAPLVASLRHFLLQLEAEVGQKSRLPS